MLLLVLFSTLGVAQSAFPSVLKKCHRKDPEVAKCYVDAANHGIRQMTRPLPEANLPSFAPLKVTEFNVGKGAKGVVNVDQNFKNCKLYNLEKVTLTKLFFDFEKKTTVADGFVEELRKNCDYVLNGKVLLLPIIGEGKSTIILKNLKFTLNLVFEEFEKKGKQHMRFTSTKLTLNPEDLSLNFENLFSGDKRLGDNINKVLNENSKEVFKDVKEGYEQAFSLIFQHLFNSLTNKMSIEDIFD